MAEFMPGATNIPSQLTVGDAATDAVLGGFTEESKNPCAWGTSCGLI
jgi:hypothetical protein